MILLQPFHLVSLDAITRFNIPGLVPLDGEASYEEIADSNVALTKPLVQSLMRHAVARGIFTNSDRPNHVRHNDVSALLATNSRMMDYCYIATQSFWPAGTRCVDAAVKYPGSGEANETVPVSLRPFLKSLLLTIICRDTVWLMVVTLVRLRV